MGRPFSRLRKRLGWLCFAEGVFYGFRGALAPLPGLRM